MVGHVGVLLSTSTFVNIFQAHTELTLLIYLKSKFISNIAIKQVRLKAYTISRKAKLAKNITELMNT